MLSLLILGFFGLTIKLHSINAVQLDIDLNEPLAHGGDLWPIEQEAGRKSPLDSAPPKQSKIAPLKVENHLKVQNPDQKAMKRKHSQTFMKNLRADSQKYSAYLLKKNKYEKQRRKEMAPEKKKEYIERNKIYQNRFYTKKRKNDPNYRREAQRPALRKHIEEGTATEQQIARYYSLLEIDKRYQANKRAKKKMEKQNGASGNG